MVLDSNQVSYARLQCLRYLKNDSGEDDIATTESEYLSSNMSPVEAEHDDDDEIKSMIPKNIHCQVESIVERMWSLSMCYSY